ncbi:hypothetical protein [Pseudomonas viridiflava]|uniref:hypothetical protein n=1 Tax=Pseudomonas viridiflava TaxID=33069 RepID=UPI0013C2B0D9|nr:hypothetical protein [Pseudomonas viridiflava]
MLDRKTYESRYRETVGYEWSELTDLEVRLLQLYRQMPESSRKQIRRIAGFLAESADDE